MCACKQFRSCCAGNSTSNDVRVWVCGWVCVWVCVRACVGLCVCVCVCAHTHAFSACTHTHIQMVYSLSSICSLPPTRRVNIDGPFGTASEVC